MGQGMRAPAEAAEGPGQTPPWSPRGPGPVTPLKHNTHCSQPHQGSEETQPTHLLKLIPLQWLWGQRKSDAD